MVGSACAPLANIIIVSIKILLNYEGDWVALEDSITIGVVQKDLCKYDVLTLCYRLVQQPVR